MWAGSDGKGAGQDPRLDPLLHLNHDWDDRDDYMMMVMTLMMAIVVIMNHD